jgi:uncharacterized protein (TIGR02145 family)
MKKKLLIVLVLIITVSINNIYSQGVSINEDGADPHASAILDIQSTTKGLLIPRVDFIEMYQISNPAVGLLVYCTSFDKFYFYVAGGWNEVGGEADDDWTLDGDDMYNNNSGNIGIGSATSVPTHRLTVENADANNVLRLIGNDAYGSGAKLNFGDGDYVYIHEVYDDMLSIGANNGIGLYSHQDIAIQSNYSNINLYTAQGSVAVFDFPTTPEESAILDVSSDSKGMLIPRMTTEQITAIADPADGLQVYNTTDGSLYIFVESAYKWKQISYGSGVIVLPIPGCGDPFVDERDGKSYNTVQIYDRCWMAENLNYGTLSTGGQYNDSEVQKACYYGNETYCDEYGAFYTWYEVMNWTTTEGGQGICPEGWHIPTDSEIYQMENFLDPTINNPGATSWRGSTIANQLKETGTTHWNGGNTAATNSSGFTLLGTGYRSYNNSYYNLKNATQMWSSTDAGSYAFYREFSYSSSLSYRSTIPKNFYFSVRCIKD